MTIRKAVVLTAGYGTRLLPATKALPKEMLPLVDKPLIQYIVEEAVAAGVEQVILVTASGKRAVEDHFDRSLELEAYLQAKGDEERLAEIRRISEIAEIVSVRQKEALGVGHAVLQARHVVGKEPFLLLFPDDIIEGEVPASLQLARAFDRAGGSVIAVERVPWEDVENYGIASGEDLGGGLWRVDSLVEKPRCEVAKSNLAIVGRYVLTPEIFGAIERTGRGHGGEIQLTDGLDLLRDSQAVYVQELTGARYDAGRPLGLLQAAIGLALGRPDIGPQLRDYLRRALAE